MFITCALVLSVLMLAAEKHQATAFAPVRVSVLSTLRISSTHSNIQYGKLNPGQDATNEDDAAQAEEDDPENQLIAKRAKGWS
ncbi:hypothetical protein H0H93_001034 [Arthromyces matolae]|nr:hypothetical protein H0H93_001034 [Arthromyces matolae]